MQNDRKKLDQLTSLRFFAAFMIVIHHSVGLFGIRNIGINLGQGVSFFFVLSGFILAFVYPNLGSWGAIRNFWRARIARIWPAYMASFLLGFWLLSYNWEIKTAAAYLTMVQAWIPLSTYYFSYNAVAWSVSTELFFYLAFPFLLRNWKSRWFIKLALSSFVLVALVVLSERLALPTYGDPSVKSNGLMMTQHGLLYINPVSRIFEFIFGMCIALAWRSGQEKIQWSSSFATAYELGSVILCALSICYVGYIASWFAGTVHSASLWLWMAQSGSAFAFGLMIYCLALGRGYVSKMLAHPVLVLLGEISFSIYLIHQILLGYYRSNAADFAQLSDSAARAVFVCVLLLSSYLMWALIEMPGRRLIVGDGQIHGTPIMKKSWSSNAALSRRTFLAGTALGCIIGFMNFMVKDAGLVSLEPIEEAKGSTVRINSPGSCNIETIDSEMFAKEPIRISPGSVRITGWFLPERSKKTGKPAFIRFQSESGAASWQSRLVSWTLRQDVTTAMHGADLGNAGFSQRFDLSSLLPGRYSLAITFSDDGTAYACDNQKILEIE